MILGVVIKKYRLMVEMDLRTLSVFSAVAVGMMEGIQVCNTVAVYVIQ